MLSPGRSLTVTVALLATLLVSSSWAVACEPPFTAWFLNGSFPADGDDAAPINGVIAVDLQYVDSFSGMFPTEEVFAETVQLEVLRGGTEPVPGLWVYEPRWQRALFVGDRPFAEGVAYTVEVGFLNSQLGPQGLDDMETSFTFTTGNRQDEVAPAFSGLQSFTLGEREDAVSECCPSDPEACIGMCGACEWCWTVGWRYRAKAQLSFRPVEDEFGRSTIAYAVYRLDGASSGPPAIDAEPVSVVKDVRNDELRLEFLLEEGDAGPFCYFVRAHDLFGRVDANTNVLCRTREELVPVPRSDVPAPDRTGCFDNTDEDAGLDSGEDAGEDAGQDEDVSGADAEADVPDDGEDVAVNPNVTTREQGGSCDCSVLDGASSLVRRWFWLLGLGLFGLLRRRR